MVIKRMWDETSMTVAVRNAELAKFLPAFAESMVELPTIASSGRKHYAVQSFQQQCFMRWGPSEDESCHLAVPMRIIPSTTASAIFSGLNGSSRHLSLEALSDMARHVRFMALVVFPDALAANRLCSLFYHYPWFGPWCGRGDAFAINSTWLATVGSRGWTF
ncbi:unnamed protein product [Prorocentrum cordatum]|uniref:Uncharacterized protein n=1 Tax=Prorocentrum cordatum TaxID=2364126 RepID=A0ABN9S9Z8_9DINO|nr:unnamed protein product [Polarella glacialis]